MSAVSERARELHAKHHPGDGYVTCAGCRTAAQALLHGRQRLARPRNTGEPVTRKRADGLTPDDVGRIVFTLGNRGYLINATKEDVGTWVCTTVGVAVYPDDTEFAVWGP